MNYIELNTIHKQKMDTLCNNAEHFEWEESHFIDLLKGELPQIRNTSRNAKITELFHNLTKEYNSYSFFNSDPKTFISEISKTIDEIRKIEPYWSGLLIHSVQETMKLHKGCLISGEGGIGKSYFIKCLEEQLVCMEKKHLCLYGKFCPNISDIDFNEIISVAQKEEFVFIFDAINEVDEQSQVDLANEIKKIKDVKGLRIIITYRNHTVDESILEKYRDSIECTYEFAGVSFESAIEWLQKIPITDINEYVDVLFSNNPFLLSKLPYILNGKQDINKNNVSRFTYIYEQFIKISLNKSAWEKTKRIAEFLYKNNTKSFSIKELLSIISEPLNYVSIMEQKGLIVRYGSDRFSFVIESLADYLIVRHMLKEISGKSIDECSQIIKEKIKNFHNLNTDTIIVMLFDKFTSDYSTIKKVLKETDLLSEFRYETLIKIHFKQEDIPIFLEQFSPTNPTGLIINFAGYLNKPFNCTNFLNEYYISNFQKQTIELSKHLSGKHFLGSLKNRLKNILYLTCKCTYGEDRSIENFYTAIWCSAACNQDIRSLAVKILFELLQKNPFLIRKTIDIYGNIADDYIKDAIIYVLSSCKKNSYITSFFEDLLKKQDFVLAKSIKRMSTYLEKPYDYINLDKKNIYNSAKQDTSEGFIQILHRIDLEDKDLLPFRFWSVKSFHLNRDFLSAPKQKISQINTELMQNFTCVQNGFCNGSMCFEENISKLYPHFSNKSTLKNKAILSSLETIFKQIFLKYGLPFDYEESQRQDDPDFEASILRKCVCISTDIFLGSLMCNYYLNEFATYNNYQNSIGYEVYDPLEYGEELNIKSPLPIYQPKIEKMSDKILSRIKLPKEKDEAWWKDLDITKENILNMLQPFNYDRKEWMLISCRISLRDTQKQYAWKDTYDLFICTSSKETIINDGNERYLTIETKNYTDNLLDYKNCLIQPWLCKSVPSIAYSSELFDDTRLVLPPAEIISDLNLTLNFEDMCWYDSKGEKIICCNNNKSSYYDDPIMGAVFMRKDIFEKLQKCKPIKFFAFAEKYIKDKGFCEDTAYHFEIINSKIVKAFPNGTYKQRSYDNTAPKECKNCKYGFYVELDLEKESKILADIIKNYGY